METMKDNMTRLLRQSATYKRNRDKVIARGGDWKFWQRQVDRVEKKILALTDGVEVKEGPEDNTFRIC